MTSFFSSHIQTYHCISAVTASNIDRDIVLTPNETNQNPGKTIYFDPNEVVLLNRNNQNAYANRHHPNEEFFNTNKRQHDNINDDNNDGNDDIDGSSISQNDEIIPWEVPLKHAFYLVLNNKIDGNSNKRYEKKYVFFFLFLLQSANYT